MFFCFVIGGGSVRGGGVRQWKIVRFLNWLKTHSLHSSFII